MFVIEDYEEEPVIKKRRESLPPPPPREEKKGLTAEQIAVAKSRIARPAAASVSIFIHLSIYLLCHCELTIYCRLICEEIVQTS